MAETRQEKRRAIARGYAALIGLFGSVLILACSLLVSAFGFTALDAKFLGLLLAPALAAFVLAYFIWHERVWALAAGVALMVFLRLGYAGIGAEIELFLLLSALLCAIFTGTFVWFGRSAAGENDPA